MDVRLSVVVPCYNEQKRLRDGFDHYHNYLRRQKYNWELIFVNDGSDDNTPELLKKLTLHKNNIKIISYAKNRGKGYAITHGMLEAMGKYILFTDIDHSVPIETIQTFFPYFAKGYKVVIGSRRVKGAKILVHQNRLRETLGRGFTLLVNLFTYWGIADATCGFKAFENKTAKIIFSKIKIYDWAFDAEVLFLCKKNKIKIAQVPVSWSDAEGSRVKLKGDIINSLLGLFKIRLNDLKNQYS